MRPEQVSKILNEELISVMQGHHTPVMLWGAPGNWQIQNHLSNGDQEWG